MKKFIKTILYLFVLVVILIILVTYLEKRESENFLSDTKILEYKDKYEKELHKKPYDKESLDRLCLIEIKLKNYQKALILINRSLLKYPNDSHNLITKGSLLVIDKKYNEAESCFLKSINIDETNYIPFVYLTLLNSKKRDSEKMKMYLEKALSLNFSKTNEILRSTPKIDKIKNDSIILILEN